MEVVGRGVQSVEVGGRILTVMACAGQPLMLRDIAAGAEVTPAQAHAYLVSFRKIDLVEQDVGSGRYQLGSFALQLGLARLRSFNPLRMAGDAIVGLAAELGLMVTLTVWGSFGATIVQLQEATDQMHVNVRAGAVYSITGTATGRVFAAFLPATIVEPRVAAEMREEERSQRIGQPLSADQLAREIAGIRRLGYATALGSPIPGVNAVSAPVFDHTGQLQFAITLIGPARLVDVGRDSLQTQRLLAFTTHLSAQLGYSSGAAEKEQTGPDAGLTVVQLTDQRGTADALQRKGQKRRA